MLPSPRRGERDYKRGFQGLRGGCCDTRRAAPGYIRWPLWGRLRCHASRDGLIRTGVPLVPMSDAEAAGSGQGGVGAVGFHEEVVGALFDDGAVLDDEDGVGEAGEGEAVGDD